MSKFNLNGNNNVEWTEWQMTGMQLLPNIWFYAVTYSYRLQLPVSLTKLILIDVMIL